MNIEIRIAQLERLLSDVSTRRARVPSPAPVPASHETPVAGWNRLELGFRTALNSVKAQRDAVEIGLHGRCA